MCPRGQESSSKAGIWRRAFIRKELICIWYVESSSPAVLTSLLLACSSSKIE